MIFAVILLFQDGQHFLNARVGIQDRLHFRVEDFDESFTSSVLSRMLAGVAARSQRVPFFVVLSNFRGRR